MSFQDIKIGLIGFDQTVANKMQECGLDIKCHIYSNTNNKKKHTVRTEEIQNIHSWKSYNFPDTMHETIPDTLLATAKQKCFKEFIRCTQRWPWSAELIHNWNDYDHLFQLACDQAYGWIKKHKINCMVFSNIPHQGIAIAHYFVAKELGLKTLVFLQSTLPNKSFLVENWEDLGTFKTSIPGPEFDMDISPPTKAPFYMNTVKSDNKRIIRNLAQRLRATIIIGLNLLEFNKEKRRKNFQRNIDRWKTSIENARYHLQAKKLFSDTPENESYVYFPLHLQPEMTTDVLGGQYADQLFTLENLRKIVPNEITLYVKENPKQTGILRSELFFQRLEKIPNTKFIGRKVPSFDLIKNAIAVSTITGTAGWEALRMGKPVIVFGHTFWNKLPGAFHTSNPIKWSSIEKYKFNSSQFQKATNNLSKYFNDCVCDEDYASQVTNYNAIQNAQKLSDILIKKLQNNTKKIKP